MRLRNLVELLLAIGWIGSVGCDTTTFEHHVAYRSDGGLGGDACTALPEICDGVDNDCDGLIDNDDPGVQANDVANCGQCGRACDLPNVEIHTCEDGECGIAKCDPGYTDLNETAADGCESDCQKTSDWDPCDGEDNDCNGVVDDGYDLQNDPNNCGACNFRCADHYPEATYHVISFGCSAGQCAIAACEQGYYDRDGVMDDGNGLLGCEYQCTVTSTVELCNMVDDDCDGHIDNNPVDAPTCLTQGVCAGTSPVCDSQTGTWSCDYPASYQLIEDNDPVIGCDGQDNDCDGVVDEGFFVGVACEAGQGACRRAGVRVCNAGGTDSECDAVPGTPGIEVCDDQDNDCDGDVDEADPNDPNINQFGAFVYISTGNFTIFAHEASRPGATGSDAGSGENHSPCSASGVLPWSNLTANDTETPSNVTAAQACAALGFGWRLCTATEWYQACSGGSQTFPYGNTYQTDTCNGYDYGSTHGGVEPRATGALSGCARGGVFDLSGNLKEWVVNGGNYELRGGAYNIVGAGSSAPGLECGSVSPVDSSTEVHLPSVGFRCCIDGQL